MCVLGCGCLEVLTNIWKHNVHNEEMTELEWQFQLWRWWRDNQSTAVLSSNFTRQGQYLPSTLTLIADIGFVCCGYCCRSFSRHHRFYWHKLLFVVCLYSCFQMLLWCQRLINSTVSCIQLLVLFFNGECFLENVKFTYKPKNRMH